MINLKFWKKYLNDEELSLCGVKYENDKEILIVDEILATKANRENRRVWIPIRFNNFNYAISRVMEASKSNILTVQLFRKAVEFVKINCFGAAGEPVNMAEKLGISSYSKLLEVVETDLRLYQL